MAVEGTPFAAFEKASFGGLEFPYTSLTIRGGTRFTQHEFPHAPGAEIEKGGRKAYIISFRAFFHDIPKSVLEKEYPQLFPLKANQLRAMLENEITDDLLVPNIGKIPCYGTSWVETIDTKVLTGSTLELDFIEDQERALLADGQLEVGTFASVADASDELLAKAAIARFKSEKALSMMQQINDVVTKIQAVAGTADAFNRVIEGKLRALENLCIWADSQVEEMQDPSNHLVINALKDLWFAASTCADNITESQQRLLTRVVPKRMSASQLSTLIYGDTEHAYDLMQINPFPDPLAIAAGTVVKYLSEG